MCKNGLKLIKTHLRSYEFLYRPNVALPLLALLFVFVFPQLYGKVIRIYEWTASWSSDSCYDIHFTHYSAHGNFR